MYVGEGAAHAVGAYVARGGEGRGEEEEEDGDEDGVPGAYGQVRRCAACGGLMRTGPGMAWTDPLPPAPSPLPTPPPFPTPPPPLSLAPSLGPS